MGANVRYWSAGTFATFCSLGTKSVYECDAECNRPRPLRDLGYRGPQFSTTRAVHEDVLLATACHRGTLRVVGEHQKCE
jgi:hypothetical protein